LKIATIPEEINFGNCFLKPFLRFKMPEKALKNFETTYKQIA